MASARRDVLRREAARTTEQQRLANGAFLIVTPLATALLGLGTPRLLQAFGILPVAAVWSVLLGLYVVFWLWANPTQISLLKLLAENEDKDDLITEQAAAIVAFKRSTTRLVTALSRLAAARTMIVGFVEAGIDDLDALREALGELLLPVVRRGEL